MKEISLNKGYVSIVDDDDYEKLNNWKWFFHLGYAKRTEYINPKKSRVHFMHREITNVTKGMDVDHINGNRLDNRKENLRICTHQQNVWNTSSQVGKTSKYRGVFYNSKKQRWLMTIKKNGVRVVSKVFKTELEAAYAFDQNAIMLFGIYAKLNGIKKEDVVFHNSETSPYRGVSYDRNRNKWLAQIYHEPKHIYIGRYASEHEAALAYNKVAIQLKGDKAKLNIID